MNIKRKLRQIIDAKIPEYYYKRYPYLLQFIYGFINFVDLECAKDIMNLTENLDPDTINDKFLDDYFDQYCKNLLSDSYQLTDENKRLFLSLSKFLYNNKGRKLSFDIALKYLTRYFVYSDENYVETIDYEVIENVDYWSSYETQPPIAFEVLPFLNPYTYTIRGDFKKRLVVSMIEQLNPVGFYPEFQFPIESTETWNITSTTELWEIAEGPINIDIHYTADSVETSYQEYLYEPEFEESADVAFKLLYYNGLRQYNGLRKFNCQDTGLFELYSIVASDLGTPYDTFEKLTE